MLVLRRKYWDVMNMFWTAHRKRSVSKLVGLPPNKKEQFCDDDCHLICLIFLGWVEACESEQTEEIDSTYKSNHIYIYMVN